ncbi:MAG: transaldolase [Pseudomonadota bacterium]
MKWIHNLNIKLFADTANKQDMLDLYSKNFIQGITTNPSLMRKVGVSDYRAFAKEMLLEIKDKPISFEVFSDDLSEIQRQAFEIASWGSNVYVKIPIMNTKRQSCKNIIATLSHQSVKLNITALMTIEQINECISVLNPTVPSFISIFSGRIADTGVDPIPIIQETKEKLSNHPFASIIWASTRELYNIFQANAAGCHIITVTQEILKKLDLVGYDLNEYSLDTIKMFYQDAVSAGYIL